MLEAAVGVLGVMLTAVIGWAVTMSNRVAVLEADKDSLSVLIQARFDDVTRRLQRIENKMDKEEQD